MISGENQYAKRKRRVENEKMKTKTQAKKTLGGERLKKKKADSM